MHTPGLEPGIPASNTLRQLRRSMMDLLQTMVMIPPDSSILVPMPNLRAMTLVSITHGEHPETLRKMSMKLCLTGHFHRSRRSSNQ